MNIVVLSGRIGTVPKLAYTPKSGKPYCTLSVATDRHFTVQSTGEKVQEVEWHRVTLWGSAAENAAKYLVKGQAVVVNGRLQTRSYEKDGQTHYSTQILADHVEWGAKPKPKDPKGGSGADTDDEGGHA